MSFACPAVIIAENIYAQEICNQINVGHAGQKLAEGWLKHKYEILNCPDQNEMSHGLLIIAVVGHGCPNTVRITDMIAWMNETNGRHLYLLVNC